MTRKTLIALAVFAVLLVITVVVGLLPERREEIAWSIPKLSDTLDRVEIGRGGKTLVIEKKGDAWAITQPRPQEVSDTAIKGLLELFDKPIGMSLKIPVKADELAQYELDPAKGVTLKLGAGGKELTAFVIGKALGNSTFIKPLDADVVYRARASLRWKVDKDLDDWREKKILAVDQAKIKQLTLRRPDGAEIELVKQGEDWKITRPLAADADGSTVGALLGALAGLSAASFADETPPEQAGFGPADRPLTLLVTTDEPGAQPRGIEIGGPAKGADAGKEQPDPAAGTDSYVRRVGSPQLFVVRGYSINGLNKDLGELRDRTMLNLPVDQVTGLTLQTGESKVVLAREADRWVAREPAELVDKLDESQVNSIVSSLVTLRAASLAPEGTTAETAGLTPPAGGTVTVQLKDGSSKTLLLGKKQDGNEGKVFARLGDGTTIYELAEFSAQRFLRGPSSLRRSEGGAPPGMPAGLPPGMMMPPGMMPPGMMPPGMMPPGAGAPPAEGGEQ